MTGSRGPKSKQGAGRQSPADRKKGTVRLSAAKAVAPELVGDYLPATRNWWEAWLAAPQVTFFSATDWQRLLMLAPLVDAYFEKPSPQLMSEIRQNEAKLGATAADRDRLGWKIEEPEPEEDEDSRQPSRTRKDPRTK